MSRTRKFAVQSTAKPPRGNRERYDFIIGKGKIRNGVSDLSNSSKLKLRLQDTTPKTQKFSAREFIKNVNNPKSCVVSSHSRVKNKILDKKGCSPRSQLCSHKIQNYQKSMELVISKLQFQKIVAQIAEKLNCNHKFLTEAISVLHEASEDYIISRFEETNIRNSLQIK